MVVSKIKKEIEEILTAINNGESDSIICDSYEDYSKSMLDFIKTKNKIWFSKLFNVITEEIDNGADEISLKKELQIKKLHKNLINHIIDKIFSEDIIVDDQENDGDDEENNPIHVPLEEAVCNFKWRDNQSIAINNTITQKFKSGVHNQIMGAGKTYIIFKTISAHFEKYPNKKLYIIACFRQEILQDLLFDKNGKMDEKKSDKLKKYGIIDLDDYLIIDRVHEKKKTLKLAKNKPTILIVNTDYLKIMDLNYDDINFVILDECHSVSASKLYTILNRIKYDYKKHIIGFSATPLRKNAEKKLVDIFSSTTNKNSQNKKLNIISNYDFVNAIRDDVILPPHYILCEVNKTLNGKIGKDNKNIMEKVLDEALKLVPYKKVIGWCRSIEQMKVYYKYIKEKFPDLKIFCSSFCDNALEKLGYRVDWHKFSEKNDNCILLCVNRFREGSDIMNLDTAIYLDTVKKRSLLVALQTSGRVLRKDNLGKKTHGVIIDSFVNFDGIQIEVMTAERIINYYKQIFMLCDDNDYVEQKESYDRMVDICKNMKYDEKKQEIVIKVDDDDKHNMKIRLQLKTKTYDFSKLKLQLGDIIDKMYNVDKKIRFNQIVDKLKNGKWFSVKTMDFWETYERIPVDKKEKNGIPASGDDLYKKYEDIFDTSTWYQILELDTSMWYQSINKCRSAISKIGITVTNNKSYYDCVGKNKKLPLNPSEYFKLTGFTNVANEFSTKPKKIYRV